MEEKFHSRITLKPKQKHRGRTESELGCGNENAIACTSIFESTNQPYEESVTGRDVAMEDVDREACQTSRQNVRNGIPPGARWYPYTPGSRDR